MGNSSYALKRGPQGATGISGADAFIYVAYASDSSGTGFTTTFDAGLNFIAVRRSSTALTPLVGDFDGLWKNYKGETGATGPEGPQGVIGPQGDVGATGATGGIGLTGDTGPQGVIGDPGPTGAAGDFIYVAYASADDGSGFTTTFDATLDYIAVKRSATEIVSPVQSDFGALWKNYKGVDGPQGATGLTGITGSTGIQGSIGETGVTGAAGAAILNGGGTPSDGDGSDGDYYLNVSDGSFYEKVSGVWNQVFNLTGPQGVQGPTGTPGQHAEAVLAVAGETFAAGELIFQDYDAALGAVGKWWKVDADAAAPARCSRRIGIAVAEGVSPDTDLVPTMTGEAAPEGEAFASSERIGEEAWRAFDKISGSKWRTNAAVAAWLRILLVTQRTVITYKITADTIANAPRDWLLQGSDNGFSWTLVDTKEDQTFTAGQTRTFTCDSSGAFFYYRLNISTNGGDANTAVRALTLHADWIDGTVQCEPTPITYAPGGLTVGEPVYASATAGEITQSPGSAGTPKRKIGVAMTANEYHFLPWMALTTPYSFTVAVGDQVFSIEPETSKLTFLAECDFRLDEVAASVVVASSAGVLEFDVRKNGTTIFSVRPTIDATEKTSASATIPAVLGSSFFVKGDEISVDIIASGTGARGAILTFNGER